MAAELALPGSGGGFAPRQNVLTALTAIWPARPGRTCTGPRSVGGLAPLKNAFTATMASLVARPGRTVIGVGARLNFVVQMLWTFSAAAASASVTAA
jgi:hypothetical protein